MIQRRIESFLVRIVVDERPGCQPHEWRGRLQHIGSGSEAQFESMPQLIELVRAHAGLSEEPTPAVNPPAHHS